MFAQSGIARSDVEEKLADRLNLRKWFWSLLVLRTLVSGQARRDDEEGRWLSYCPKRGTGVSWYLDVAVELS